MPHRLVPDKTYAVNCEASRGIAALTLPSSIEKSRSEAVHVNLLGYAPGSPAKFAYVYHWAGDQGSVDLSFLKGKSFRLVDDRTGKTAFSGDLAFRAPADQQETGQLKDTPNGNFLCAEDWQCDFSTFTAPRAYVVSVDDVGCSFPFRIDADV